MMPLVYIETSACVLLLVFLIWKEGQRPDRSRLSGRVAATVLAVVALAGMVVPLHYYRVVKVPPAVVSHPGPLRRGVVAVNWERRLMKGERLQVQGKWAGNRVKLLLTGLGGVMDSAVSGSDFTLGTVPAQTGRAVYQLVAVSVSGTDTLEREDIPVQVETGKPLKILILAAAPGFENTFLFNWLASNGQQVAYRAAVSRNDHQSSFANMAPQSLAVLTPRLLDGFDVVVTDSSGPAVLRRQVEEKGLGLIIRIDSADPAGVDMGWGRLGLRVLERDSSKRATVAGRLYGSGKVVFTALNTTYSQMMTGQRQAYAGYWSTILRRVSREKEPGEKWQLQPALPRVGEPVTAVVQTAAAAPQGLIGEEGGDPVTIYLAQEEMLPFRWRGTYWPTAAGWQVVRTPQGDTTWFYVWPRTAWAALYEAQQLRKAGSEDRAESEAGGQSGNKAGLREAVALPAYWSYTLFLLSVFFLWVEKKVARMSSKLQT